MMIHTPVVDDVIFHDVLTSATDGPALKAEQPVVPETHEPLTYASAARVNLDIRNLLLGLAWCAEMSTLQIRRVWFNDTHVRSTQVILRDLYQEGWIKPRRWAIKTAHQGAKRQPYMWSLTKRGRKLVEGDEQYPLKYVRPRSRHMLPHDVMTTETIVRLIELGRGVGLSAIYIEREMRVDPLAPRPIMDAFVVMRFGGTFESRRNVPWSNDPSAEDEKRRRFAIENDRNSEGFNVIAAKALAYQAQNTDAWRERNRGAFPTPLWIVPTEGRLQTVMRAWKQTWPAGQWLITTDQWLQQDRWIEYRAGETRERPLFRAAR